MYTDACVNVQIYYAYTHRYVDDDVTCVDDDVTCVDDDVTYVCKCADILRIHAQICG
jgi:ligand-binding SRPBCC domain-containing protein